MGGVRVGGQLAGYHVESVIGRGGMSVVYLAEHIKLGRKVTLKVLTPELATDPAFRERFVRESRLAATLDHPHIVPIYEADEADGLLFIAMRYVRGTDLDALISQEGPLPLDRAISIVGQVASALDAAHAEGLVHRDVKPANILVSPGVGPGAADHTYLSDFGITKRLSYTTAAASGEIMGTVDYVAPEQIEGGDIDGRADVYSLGCVLYQCLAAAVPFPRDSELAVLWAHTRERPPRITTARADVPTALDPVIAKAMAKRREDRYQRCGELSLAARKASGVDRREPPQTRRSRTRRRLAVAIGATAVVAATGVIAAIVVHPPTGPGPVGHTITLRRIDGETNQLTDRAWDAPSDALGMADGDGGEWIITPNELVFISVVGAEAKRVPIPFTPSDIDVGFGFVWVVGADAGGGGELVRVDPAEPVAPRTLPLSNPAKRVAVGRDSVWVLTRSTVDASGPPTGGGGSTGSSTLETTFITRVDPETMVRGPSYPAPGAVDLAAGEQGVWFAHRWAGTVDNLNLLLGTIEPTIPVNGRPTAIAIGEGSQWVIDGVRNLAIPVDPRIRAPGPPVQVGGQPFALVVVDGTAWVANAKSACRINIPADLTKQASCIHIPVGQPVVAIAADVTAPADRSQVWILVRTAAD